MESSDRPDRDADTFEVAVIRRAQDRLARSPYSALGRVTSSYHRGALELRGCLPSQYLKQVAQELVSRIDGVDAVINQIEVRVAADVVGVGAGAARRGPDPGPAPGSRGDSARGG